MADTPENVWTRRFLELAEHISAWSKDPSSKIGAVITDPCRRIVSTGYNGFPRGVADSADRLTDREMKYMMVLHAEENAILFSRQDLSGCSLYVTKMPPCSHCAALIAQSGIKRVYAPASEVPERWTASVELAKTIFSESGVELTLV